MPVWEDVSSDSSRIQDNLLTWSSLVFPCSLDRLMLKELAQTLNSYLDFHILRSHLQESLAPHSPCNRQTDVYSYRVDLPMLKEAFY